MDNSELNAKERFHALETRIQTVGMVLIVGFLSWVGTGLVDVKVGLAQVLSESVSLRATLDRQEQRLSQIETEISAMQRDMSNYVTREEFREIVRWGPQYGERNSTPED